MVETKEIKKIKEIKETEEMTKEIKETEEMIAKTAIIGQISSEARQISSETKGKISSEIEKGEISSKVEEVSSKVEEISSTARKIPLELTKETALDFGISPKDLRPIKIGSRRTRGIYVPCTKEVYDAYMRPLWREEKRALRHRDLSLSALHEAWDMEIAIEEEAMEIAEAGERRRAVQKALARLPEKDRAILTLFAKGAKTGEIAEKVGMTRRGVSSRKRQSLARLKAILEE